MKNKLSDSLIISTLMALGAIYSLAFVTKIDGNYLIFNNSILSLLLLCTFSYIISKSLKIMNFRLFLHSFILGWLLSLSLILGTELYLVGGLYYTPFKLLQKLINTTLFSFITAPMIGLFIYYLPTSKGWLDKQISAVRFQKTTLTEKQYFVRIWLFILLCWVPCFLAYFPGVFSYDTPWQVMQIFTGEYNTHHPLLHSLYLALCLKTGLLFGSLQIGVAIHSLIQMLMLSATFAYTCLYIHRFKAPTIIHIISILYFALMPIHPLWAVNATKDVPFSACLLLIILFLLQLAENPSDFFHSKIHQFRLILLIVLMCALRNNGFYMFLLFIPVMILMLKGYRHHALILCLLTVIIHLVIGNLTASILKSDSGNIGEALSVPIQQLARTVNHVDDQLSEEVLATIFEIIPEEDIYKYVSHISDPVKEHFNQENFKNDPSKYVKLWINLGLRYPQLYLDSFFCNTYGLWYPDNTWIFKGDDNLSTYLLTKNLPASNEIEFYQTPLLPKVRIFYEKIATYSEYEKYPVISMLFSIGFQFWTLCLFATTFSYYKRNALLLPLALLLTLWISLLLSPVILLRYTYPFFISIPVFLSLVYSSGLITSVER